MRVCDTNSYCVWRVSSKVAGDREPREWRRPGGHSHNHTRALSYATRHSPDNSIKSIASLMRWRGRRNMHGAPSSSTTLPFRSLFPSLATNHINTAITIINTSFTIAILPHPSLPQSSFIRPSLPGYSYYHHRHLYQQQQQQLKRASINIAMRVNSHLLCSATS